jgi:hypothetical protein
MQRRSRSLDRVTAFSSALLAKSPHHNRAEGILVIHQNLHVPGLFFAKAQMIAAQAEFNRITQWGSTNDFDARAVAEAHFEQPAAQFRIAANRHDITPATDAHLVQCAGFGGPTVIASRKATCLLHTITLLLSRRD